MNTPTKRVTLKFQPSSHSSESEEVSVDEVSEASIANQDLLLEKEKCEGSTFALTEPKTTNHQVTAHGDQNKDTAHRVTPVGVFGFPYVVLVLTPLKVVAFLLQQNWMKTPKLSSLLRHFVATLHHDNNCYIRCQQSPKHRRLRQDQQLVNSVFGYLQNAGSLTD